MSGLGEQVVASPIPAHPGAAEIACEAEEGTMPLSLWRVAPSAYGGADEWGFGVGLFRHQANFTGSITVFLTHCMRSDFIFHPHAHIERSANAIPVINEEAVFRSGRLAGGIEQGSGVKLASVEAVAF